MVGFTIKHHSIQKEHPFTGTTSIKAVNYELVMIRKTQTRAYFLFYVGAKTIGIKDPLC